MREIRTLFVGKNFLDFPSLASTNAYAMEHLSAKKFSEGTVISTFNQKQGRGQMGNKWESEPNKNISLSIILKPNFLEVRQQFNLNIAVSLAVYDVVSAYLDRVKVKWSNDIFVHKKKIAGILLQNTLSGRFIQNSVIGIGLNVNQTDFFSNAPNPTSFHLEIGKEFDLYDLISKLCTCVEQRYLQLKAGKTEALRKEYLDHLYLKGKPATYQRKNGAYFTGIIKGISDIGQLVIETETHEETFGFKEIKFCG